MVSTTHPEYEKNKAIWESNRDCYQGQQSIKEKTTRYLPMKGYWLGLTEAERTELYTPFLQRALWFDATYRIVNTTQGLIFRKKVFIDGPKEVEKYVEDFTVDNQTLNSAAIDCVNEVLLQGRQGVLVSYPDIDTTNMSKQEVEDRNIHAYSALYKTEDIINWKLEKVAGKLVPTLVVLTELADNPDNTDIFDTAKVTLHRVLQLDEEGYYKQSTYYVTSSPSATTPSRDGALAGATLHSEYYPLINGEKFTYIPFFPITPTGISWNIERAPMSGIANINISLYQNSAEYESGISITASPTLVLKGYQKDEKDGQIVLGGNSAILLPADGDAKFLEYESAGLGDIEKAMNTKKKDMAVLGLKILSSEQNVNEGEGAASVNSVAEQASVTSIAHSVSEALTQALQLMVKWDNPDIDVDDVIVKLNTDFKPNALTANQLNSLTVLWKSMGLSDLEMFNILKRGEILPAEMTYEQHQKQLKESTFATMFADDTEDQNFKAPVDAKRLTKPEDPGNPQASKRPDVDPGGAQDR